MVRGRVELPTFRFFQFAAGEACGHAARVRVAAWCVAELAEPGGAAVAQVAGAELVGGGVRGVQQFPRVRVVAEPGGGGGAALGLPCLHRQVQAAEHLGCAAQLVCCCLRLVGQQGLAAGVGEGGDRLGLGGGLGYLRQGGGAGAGVGGQALFGEECGRPLQDRHAVVPLLGPGEAGQGPGPGLAPSLRDSTSGR